MDDTLLEKKWFIYLTDHHEGPFSLVELKDKFKQGTISSETFTWAEGMEEWKPFKNVTRTHYIFMDEVIDLNETPPTILNLNDVQSKLQELNHSIEPAKPSLEIIPEISIVDPQNNFVPEISISKTSPDEVTGELNISELEQTKTIGLQAHNETISSTSSKSKFLNFKMLFAITSIVLIYFEIAQDHSVSKKMKELSEITEVSKQKDDLKEKIYPYFVYLAQKFPFLETWISPIPQLPGLSNEERDELNRVAMIPLHSSGSKFAIALSQENVQSPLFFVSTNLPDHTQLEIHIIGISTTLLNTLSFQKNEIITIKNHLGRTNGMQQANLNSIPRGEYRVYLVESENRSEKIKQYLDNYSPSILNLPSELPVGKKILAYKTYFLGGRKDSTYLSSLKEFHDKLKLKSDQEIIELKQFFSTLESQYQSSMTKYQLLNNEKNLAKQKNSWLQFHDEWIKLQEQLNEIFEKWTSEVTDKEFFHSQLYKMTKSSAEHIQVLHELQNQFFLKNTEIQHFEKKLSEQVKISQESLVHLQFKIQETEKLPLTAEGIPQKTF